MTQPLVFIDGDQGTTGLQIHERLQGRDDLRLLTLPAAERRTPRAAPRPSTPAISPSCACRTSRRQAVASIRNPKVQVIDASSAHRTTEGWVYGFPEMTPGQDERIAGASRVSNPGCYPTGAIALLRLLVEAGRAADYPLAVQAVSAIRAAAAPAWTPTKGRTRRSRRSRSTVWAWRTTRRKSSAMRA